MRVLSIVHQADAAAGVFADAVAERGHEHEEWVISESPEPPSPVEGYGAVLVFGGAVHVDQEDTHNWLRDELGLLRGLHDLRSTFAVELDDVAFVIRMRRHPELRAAVETWLEGTTVPAEGASEADWIEWEQRKHERLLAA